MNKAIFLDRDGTMIEEKGYICHYSQVTLFPFTADAIRLMHKLGFMVIMITNQSAIARRLCTREEVEALHQNLEMVLLEKGATLQGIYYSPFHPQAIDPDFRIESTCRKPQPGLIYQAAADFNISIPDSYMMGDDLCDIQVGKNAGCKTLLVLSGKGQETREKLNKEGLAPDLISENILTAIQTIAGASGGQEPFY